MKALSMTQPWAQALFLDLKHFETRSWSTNYLGSLLIHAAKGFPKYARDFAQTEMALGRGSGRIARGAIIGKVDLVKIWRAEEIGYRLSGLERLYGDYSPGRFAWEFVNPLLIMEPIPYRGALGLFNIDINETQLVYVEEPRLETEGKCPYCGRERPLGHINTIDDSQWPARCIDCCFGPPMEYWEMCDACGQLYVGEHCDNPKCAEGGKYCRGLEAG